MAERTIQCWASFSPKSKLERHSFTAAPLGPKGVEVRVSHCAICGSDVHLINADGGYKDFTSYVCEPVLPQVCGHEVIGSAWYGRPKARLMCAK